MRNAEIETVALDLARPVAADRPRVEQFGWAARSTWW
jgi:hypothetical protein